MESVADVYKNRFLENWTNISRLRKPLIAAVSGYAVSLHDLSQLNRLKTTHGSLVEVASSP